MKTCPKCHRTFEDSFSFCLEDGSVLSSPFNKIEPETVILSGTQNNFSPNKNKKNFWKAAFITLISIFAIGFIAAIFYLNDEKKKDVSNQNNAEKVYNSDSNNLATKTTPTVSSVVSPSPTVADNSDLNTNSKENVNNTLPSLTKTLEADTTNSVLKKLKQGISYARARKMLIDSGWQAVIGSPNRELFGQEEYVVNTLNFYEMESCSGTGVGFCRFLFKDVNKRKLVIVTVNNEEGIKGGPVVNNWSFEK